MNIHRLAVSSLPRTTAALMENSRSILGSQSNHSRSSLKVKMATAPIAGRLKLPEEQEMHRSPVLESLGEYSLEVCR